MPLIAAGGTVVHCSDILCSDSTSTPGGGTGNSITIGADGLALISYYLPSVPGMLNVAHCNDVVCKRSTVSTIWNPSWSADATTSITIGRDGLGLISFFDPAGALRVAHCSNPLCSSAAVTTLDTGLNVGQYDSIAIGVDGLGAISYYDALNGNLKFAHCSNTACTSAIVRVLDNGGGTNNNVGKYTSIVSGDRTPNIVYQDVTAGDLRLAACRDVTCATVDLSVMQSANNVGESVSSTIDLRGQLIAAYYNRDQGGVLMLDISNNFQSLATIGSAAGAYTYIAMTIGVDGVPLIVYRDVPGAALKVYHCANPTNVPYLHQR